MNTEWIVLLVIVGLGVVVLTIGAVIKSMGGDPELFFGIATVFAIAAFLALLAAGGISAERRDCRSLAGKLEGEIIGSDAWRCDIRLPDGRTIST